MKVTKTVTQISNGMEIQQGLCVCLIANIYIKTLGEHVDQPFSITHDKIYKLIEDYGVKKVGVDYFVIETHELKYYILMSQVIWMVDYHVIILNHMER